MGAEQSVHQNSVTARNTISSLTVRIALITHLFGGIEMKLSKFDSCVAVAIKIEGKVLGLIQRPSNMFLMKYHYPAYWDTLLKYTEAEVVPVKESEFDTMFEKFLEYVKGTSIQHKVKIIKESLEEGIIIDI